MKGRAALALVSDGDHSTNVRTGSDAPHDHATVTCTDASAGDIIDDRYELVAPISAGAVGVVFRAVHLVTRRIVALKVMHPRVANDLGLRERTAREARFAGSIRHPNIVEVLDAGRTAAGEPFIAMEFLEGPTLRAWLRETTQPTLCEISRIAESIADAIAAAHAAGVIHRDLKPENIVLVKGPNGPVPKILDFGFAAAIEAAKSSTRLTATGTVLGTYAYMAPEQAIGASADPGFDIYAFGVMLHELLTSELPFASSGGASIAYAKLVGTLDGSVMEKTGVPQRWRQLVHRCLELDPRARPCAAELVRCLASLRTGAEMPAEKPTRSRLHPAIYAFPAVVAGLLMVGRAMLDEPVTEVETPVALELDEAGDEIVTDDDEHHVPHATIIERADVRAAARAKTSTKRKAGTRSATPLLAAGSEERCAGARLELENAKQSYRWKDVLAVLDASTCWSTNDRAKWRTKSMLELERFDDCVRVAGDSSDSDVRRWVDTCKRRARPASVDPFAVSEPG